MDYEIDSDETVSEAVMAAVSAFIGRRPVDLERLSNTVDPDALNAIFAEHPDNQAQHCGGRVEFIYEESQVIIENNEYVNVTAVDETTPRRSPGSVPT